jgi:hypothetical protein
MPTGENHPVVYYRIRCKRSNGYDVLSKTIEVTNAPNNKRLTVTPNPIDTDASVHFFAVHNTTVTVRLMSLQGNTVFTMQYRARQGMNTIYLHDLRALPDGIYLLKLKDGTNDESTKLIVRH